MGIGMRIRKARVSRGWNQAALAKNTKLKPSAISRFETSGSDPSARNLIILARALHVSTDFLCGLDDRQSTTLHPVMQNYFSLNRSDRFLATRFIKRLVEGR